MILTDYTGFLNTISQITNINVFYQMERINLIPGSEPPLKPIYTMSHVIMQELKEQLNELMEKGFNRPSN